ncbi:MAG: phosphoribosyltransferase [Acidobacteria bacterium]|nr:phosphoribosyltransferase [Acidobacteriota bacterium]
MRFTDAREAGGALASRLSDYAGRDGVVVIAVARGGVGVAAEVSRRLALPLDVVLVSRLLAPRPDDPLCAANVAGTPFLDEGLSAHAARDPAFANYLAQAAAELGRRARACRGARPALALSGRTVLLVDNGVRTGSTLRAVARAVRRQRPARLVACAPVADAASLGVVRGSCEEFVCLATPEPFGHVGMWYADFARPSDDEMRATLEASGRG